MMKLAVTLALMGAVATALPVRLAPATVDTYYTRTPSGYVLSHCVHTVKSGSLIEANLAEGGYLAIHPEYETPKVIPKCSRPVVDGVTLPVLIRNDLPSEENVMLPPDYNGWLAYTAANLSIGFNSYLGVFSVPNIPKQTPQILYLFTGLQNKNWVPKVDPEIEGNGFDIIQPVLQYPGDFGQYWSVKSWYVTIDSGSINSDERKCQPGDLIFGNMTKIGSAQWLVNSVNLRTNENTAITPSHPRLSQQSWAYNVLEGYGVTGCSDYPTNTCEFTKLALTDSRGVPVQPTWLVNPKPNPHPECHESITVDSPTSQTISFGN